MIAQFEVGKTYETTVGNYYTDCGLVAVGQRFTCHYIDSDGAAWSRDVKYRGKPCTGSYGWCVATTNELVRGYVRTVE